MVKKILFLTLLSVISGPLNAGDIFEKYKNAQPVEPAGSWSKKLIKYVAQDQGVDKSAVQLYKQHEGEGQGDYVVKVNDAFFAYKRIGTVYSRSKAGQRDLSAANALQQKFKDAAPLAPKGGWGKKMVSYVAQDLGVDASAVQLFKQYEGSGQGEYVVKVNGEFYEYKRMGSVYYEAGNPPF